MEHERFLKEISALPLGNQEIAQRMGTDGTRISHYRNGTKWPSKKTLYIFKHEFRNDLDVLEEEEGKRKKGYKQPADQLYLADEEESFEIYQTTPISLIKHHMALIENSLSAIKTAMEALEAKPGVDAGEKK